MLYPAAQKFSFTPHRPLFLLTFALCAVPADATSQEQDNLVFDTGVLADRNIDSGVAAMFSQAPRFMPGENTVTLFVNGSARGQARVRFNDTGTLCADKHLQQAAGLERPPGYSDIETCFDLKRGWPQAEVLAEPGENRLALIVPPQALRPAGADSGHWQHGGVAGLLNYDAQYLGTSGTAGGGLNFSQINSEAGFNARDWIIRSRQTFSRFDGDSRLNHHAAYAQRSFTGIKKVLQAGQVSLSNSLFGTGQVLGFQMFPEQALMSGAGGAGLVEGIAQTPSVVEVRQSGVLVYTTTVPSGPFRLQNFPVLNTRTDLTVTMTGSEGTKQTFVVPAAALMAQGPSVSPGLSFGAGRPEQQGGRSPMLGTAATGWQITPFTGLNAGVLGSSLYRAAAVNLDTRLAEPTQLSLQSTLAQDTHYGHTGLLLSALVNHSLSERLSVSISASQQGAGYRELSDALQKSAAESTDKDSRPHRQWGSGINWSSVRPGSFSLSWARSTTYGGDSNDYLRGGWSRQFGRAYLGAGVEYSTGFSGSPSDRRLYLTFSLPLGDGRDMNSYLNAARHSTRTGLRYSDRTSQDRGWSLAGERDVRNHNTSVTGAVDFVTPVSQLNAGISRDNQRYTSWSARASRGIVAHANGVTLSPYRVSDTFGIARAGGESGVRLDTPSGPVWTDWRGYAVLPSLNGYRRSVVQVDTRSLAKNVDIGNAWQEAELARGAVGIMNFGLVRTRRVLVVVRDNKGQPLPPGASIFGESGELVTVAGDDGTVFVPDAAPGMKLDVQSSGRTLCQIQLALPEKAEQEGLYENAEATCR